MKKNLILVAALSLNTAFLVSCSEDDNSNNNNDNSKTELFTASNTTGSVSYLDLEATMPMPMNFSTGSMDADGIYYDDSARELIIASRTNTRIEVYDFTDAATMAPASLMMKAGSTTGDFTNAREIAVSGNRVIVAQDQNADTNGNMNKLFVYQRSGSGFTLEKTFTADFKLWGIHMDGNNLYAVADLTSDLVVFNNIFSKTEGALTADKRVTIEGLVRTHGISYSDDLDTMVLTDVGNAMSDSDGGLVVIENFDDVFAGTINGGTIMMADQMRIYGPNSMMGNPVDVAIDSDSKRIYVAERLKSGGMVLTFTYPTAAASDAMPINSRAEGGVTGIFLNE